MYHSLSGLKHTAKVWLFKHTHVCNRNRFRDEQEQLNTSCPSPQTSGYGYGQCMLNRNPVACMCLTYSSANKIRQAKALVRRQENKRVLKRKSCKKGM